MTAPKTISAVVQRSTPCLGGVHLVVVKPERGPNIGLRSDRAREIGERVSVRGGGVSWEFVP